LDTLYTIRPQRMSEIPNVAGEESDGINE
jgi:hypothetical protein